MFWKCVSVQRNHRKVIDAFGIKNKLEVFAIHNVCKLGFENVAWIINYWKYLPVTMFVS